MTTLPVLISIALAIIAMALWLKYRSLRREAYIRSFVLPPGLFAKLRAQYPHLSLKDCQLVAQGLRQYFMAHHKSGYKYVSMPSQVADALWHEFILYTKNYQTFCQRAFGRFFHHTPAVVLSNASQSNAGLRRCWWHACREENIKPGKPARLPLLFALDSKLKIPNGFHYVSDCSGLRRDDGSGSSSSTSPYCGGDFCSTSFDGGTEGYGDSSSSSSSSSYSGDGGSSQSSSDSGGDSGSSGCGGGCGGGGGE